MQYALMHFDDDEFDPLIDANELHALHQGVFKGNVQTQSLNSASILIRTLAKYFGTFCGGFLGWGRLRLRFNRLICVYSCIQTIHICFTSCYFSIAEPN
ncbi:hypothetical protein [Enterovibrio nigricans]|uniref:Uncharacterized protein n=1 Tax=Enterovibrio nigricans DSM 22720 TaxID=1121868 RepID=A0A1T4V8L1_9GAMM|nr:hypothetical protein [Enterovibrio nigricans]PKF50221.1 hypothetical protein AT251_12960 [Enterovibrio nigricans]SKA61277.1 hypothetical protein SAMN02745132_03456 [Enterovibrio nigricans DSM 22720]